MKGIFTDDEFEEINDLARKRYEIKDKANPNRDQHILNNNQHLTDYLGVAGEFAVAKYFGIPMDTSVSLNGDGGIQDLNLDEWSVQVKTSGYTGRDGYMIYDTKEEIKALINILVVVKDRSYEIVGFLSKKDVLDSLVNKNFGHGDRVCVHRDRLRPIAELKYYHKEKEFKELKKKFVEVYDLLFNHNN